MKGTIRSNQNNVEPNKNTPDFVNLYGGDLICLISLPIYFISSLLTPVKVILCCSTFPFSTLIKYSGEEIVEYFFVFRLKYEKLMKVKNETGSVINYGGAEIKDDL